ncbi:MAG TPA: M48 family metalloprotease [Stellaceae bacterium]|nr:M48 family metalloprotease [Stellaceae bacterium]
MLRIVARVLGVLLLTCLAARSAGAEDLNYIRDAEIESTLRTFYMPILRAAGLDPSAVHIYLVNDARLNSFVAGGQNIFVNTGTITRSETPNQLIGIVAHETGHIAGGHLIKGEEAMRNASIESIIGMVVGAGASVLGHNPSAGGAAVLSGESVGIRSYLAFSVAQEASADQAALTFLDKTHQSARGLLQFFQILEGQELLSGALQSPYMRTHPLTTQRVAYVKNHVERSPYSDVPDPPDWVELHRRMKAKLVAFLSGPGQTLQQYPESDNSVAARYARAVAFYRVPELKKALALIDGLIQEEPKNPYFHELKGQMLFENGKVRDAVAPYQQSVKLAPDVALLRVEFAQVEIETNDPALNPDALIQLKSAVSFESRNPDTWRFLAVAYGRSGDMGDSALALAEQAMATGDKAMARQQAQRALKLLPQGSQGRLRAEDIQLEAQRKQ